MKRSAAAGGIFRSWRHCAAAAKSFPWSGAYSHRPALAGSKNGGKADFVLVVMALSPF